MKIRISLINLKNEQMDYDLVNDAEYTTICNSIKEIYDFCLSYRDELGRFCNSHSFFDWEELKELNNNDFNIIEKNYSKIPIIKISYKKYM